MWCPHMCRGALSRARGPMFVSRATISRGRLVAVVELMAPDLAPAFGGVVGVGRTESQWSSGSPADAGNVCY